MGLSLREILKTDFFRNFKVVAGHNGLDKQVQGIAILDAPDGFRWTRGKELVITSGYIFQQNPGLFESYVQSDEFKKIAGLGIKLGRFLKGIPEHIIDLFNHYDIPLIVIPLEPSWMDIMNQLNVLVMNKNIRQFNIGNINPENFTSLPYQERKINKILSQIEREMNFPAMLYDFSSEKAHYSSPRFGKLADDLKIEDFWNPSFPFTQEVLCDNLQMIRYRFYADRYDKPYSWITVPISVGDKIKAYFVVLEATGLIDYFDQFALRIGFLLLQSLYEQMLVAQSMGDIGFEKFISEVIAGDLANYEMIAKKAADLGIDIKNTYYLLLMKQMDKEVPLSAHQEVLKNLLRNIVSRFRARMAFIDEYRCVFLIPREIKFSEEKNLLFIKEMVKTLRAKLQDEIRGLTPVFGVADISSTVYDIKRNYLRCEKAISIGQLLKPEEEYFVYSGLGALAWLDIKEDEIKVMLKGLERILVRDTNKELINTLKTYLDCQMNYSLTAKHLFVHINTVRKRIEMINELIDVNLEDPVERLKLEVLLKLVK